MAVLIILIEYHVILLKYCRTLASLAPRTLNCKRIQSVKLFFLFATVSSFSDDKTTLVKICGPSFYRPFFFLFFRWIMMERRPLHARLCDRWYESVSSRGCRQRDNASAGVRFADVITHRAAYCTNCTVLPQRDLIWTFIPLLSKTRFFLLLLNTNVREVKSEAGEEEKYLQVTGGDGLYGNAALTATDITSEHNFKSSSLSLRVPVFLSGNSCFGA